MIARPRASLRAIATGFGACAPAAPAAVRRIAARVATFAVDVEPFARGVVELAAVAVVVRWVLGTRTRLHRVAAEEAAVLRMTVRVEHHSLTGRIHMARRRACFAENHRRYDVGQGKKHRRPHSLGKRTGKREKRSEGF